MSSSDHVDVIRAISDRNCVLFWITLAHHLYDLSFLLGADSAGEYNICPFAEVNELFG